tara:strand:- start:8 stop:229 length:222 start_codon:yes stop_codon:yes gene_type:complete
MKQYDRVLKHLMQGKRLTCLNAFQELGITQVAARIFELKKDGYPIGTKTIKVKNRYGDEANVVNYFLEQNDAA